jgi:hypothetical protein
VPRHVVVPERSGIDLNPRPALPGVRLVVDEVSGTVDLDGRSPGTVRGALHVRLRALVDDDGRAPGLPAWLRHGEVVVLDTEVTDARCGDDGRLDVRARVRTGDRNVPVTGAGRIHRRGPDDDAGLEVVGLTLVDPRSFGFTLPPLITYALHVRWRLVLTG